MVVRTCIAWERLVTSTEDMGHRGHRDREVSEVDRPWWYIHVWHIRGRGLVTSRHDGGHGDSEVIEADRIRTYAASPRDRPCYKRHGRARGLVS